MKGFKKVQLMIVAVMGVFFLLAVYSSQPEEMQQMTNARVITNGQGKYQEEIGREIKTAAWLEWNQGLVQEQIGEFILDARGQNGVAQEALGSGIAATGHIKLELMRTQERLGGVILKMSTEDRT